jgi:ABC-type lipoprotein release transport system permease subunit
MKFEDINHIAIQRCIIRLQVNVEDFKDMDELKKHLKELRIKSYRKKNKEYFRVYMRERYRNKKGLVVENPILQPINPI